MSDDSEPWMVAAAELAQEALEAGDKKAYRRIWDAAEARADSEGRAARKHRGKQN